MKDTSFKDYVLEDLLSGFPGISAKAMFGGWGIYKDGLVFAIIADGELYFKVDSETEAIYKKYTSHPFHYSGKDGKAYTMSYWLITEEMQEDGEVFEDLVLQAIEVAIRSKKAKKK